MQQDGPTKMTLQMQEGSALTFLGIGAQKSGTTWLHRMLCRHPDIFMPEKKELHFWDTEELTHRSILAYGSHFSSSAAIARGEITPAYGPLERETISLVHDYFPDVRLLFIMRNPIERAWSHAKMHVLQYMKKGFTVDGHLVDMETMPDHWFIDHFHSAKSTRRGDYETCIRNWLSFYPDHALRIMFYDDIERSPRALLSGCCTHLGIDSAFYDTFDERELRSRYKVSTPDTIRPALLPVLREIYLPKIKSLSEYLGMDLEGRWLGC